MSKDQQKTSTAGLIGTTKQKLDAFNVKKREAFSSDTYSAEKILAPLEFFSIPTTKKQARMLLPSTSKSREVARAGENKDGAKLVEEKPLAFLPEMLGLSPKKADARESDHNQKLNIDEEILAPLPQLDGSQLQTDEVSQLLRQILTGIDGVNFFARFGSQTPVKFIHLVSEFTREQEEHPEFYKPYSLRVAARGPEGLDHFIMSHAGLVHMRRGEPSDCTPLAAWMRESIIFSILRKIPFFKLYLYRKSFSIWFENVRFALYSKQRLKVKERLFVTRKSSSEAILSIKRNLLQLLKVSLLPLESKNTKELHVFEADAIERCKNAKKEVEDLVQKIIIDVEGVQSNIQNMYRKAKLDASAAASFSDTVGAEKVKSLVRIKEEKQLLLVLRVKTKMEYTSLLEFVKFVDLMVVETLVTLAVNTAAALSSVMSSEQDRAGRKAGGLFMIEVQFDATIDEHVFAPADDDVRTMVHGVVEAAVRALASIRRVRELDGRLTEDSGPDMYQMVNDDHQYRRSICDMQERIRKDFLEAGVHAESYHPLKQIHKSVNFMDDLAREEREDSQRVVRDARGREDTQRVVQTKLQDLKDWLAQLDKLRNRPIGVLEIDVNNLRNALQIIRQERQNDLRDFIQNSAEEKYKQLDEYYLRCRSELAARPTDLRAFAEYLFRLKTITDEEKVHNKSIQQMEMLCKLLQEMDRGETTADQLAETHQISQNLHAIEEKGKNYKATLPEVTLWCESRVPEMKESLEHLLKKLSKDLAGLLSRLDDQPFIDAAMFASGKQVLESLDELAQKVDQCDADVGTYMQWESVMLGQHQKTSLSEDAHKELESTKEKLDQMRMLWTTVKRWTEQQEQWLHSDFLTVDMEEMEKEMVSLHKESQTLFKENCQSKLLAVSDKLRVDVATFKMKLPTVLELGNRDMRPAHWEKLFNLIASTFRPGFTLAQIEDAGIMDHKDAVSETSGIATNEARLIFDLEKIKGGWDSLAFTVLNHRDQAGLFILGGLDEVFSTLEDNQVSLQTMLGDPFVLAIQTQVEEWVRLLSTLSDTIDEWTVCQRNWMYLESIFGAEDIQKQLPTEAQKFSVIDKTFKDIMIRTNLNPKVISSLNSFENGNTLLACFQHCNNDLEAIQKSLEDYLETKRMAFPRFYFLSNDELLGILSQTRDPLAVQPHMSKCFDAIKSLTFEEVKRAHNIIGFSDPGGEYILLMRPVRAEGPVEVWLLEFERAMRDTLHDQAKSAFSIYPSTDVEAINRASWLWSSCAQVTIVIDQILWTFKVTDALSSIESGLDSRAMSTFVSFSLKQIDAMVSLVRTPLDRQKRTLLGALLTIDVHARDVVRSLESNKVNLLSSFEWTKQLRYYWEPEANGKYDAFAKQTNSSFKYGYEYLGNGPRLVITPLTDVCYMTLTGALHMRLGGAPSGPAGTGKTETTKDLAKALAVYCVVFNCSDGLDYKIMGRFFSGLAQQGAWACFDEFNRIDVEVLSVIAQQVLTIQQAIMMGVLDFKFEGQIIPLNYSFGVFITMNPGYAGRTELPDNLKSLFRPVAMMVPDYRLIAEIMLFSEGFQNALPLSNKMAQLYALSSEQLSKQDHYDFGMRAVKSVLVCAGQLKRKEPETNEDILLIRAMRDSNVPKFLEQDLPLFDGILKDLFPGVDVPFVDYGKLKDAIVHQLGDLRLQALEQFTAKVIQIHETQLVRHGMMVVGESGSGKTTATTVLASSLGQLHSDGELDKDGFYKHVDRLILNPKSISAGELYGEFNHLTAEWKDGIVPKLVRDCVTAQNEGSDNRKWIIFDGPVDAVWIENMNTVLDDNKTLCLSNSERIKLPATLHMLFEVQDLKVASPATVSRCGMVYMEQVHVGIVSLVRSWGATVLRTVVGVDEQGIKNETIIAKETHGLRCILSSLEAHLSHSIEFVRLECREKVPSTNNQLAQAMCNLFSASLAEHRDIVSTLIQDPDCMVALLVYCLIWSVGANIADSSRQIFSEWIADRFSSLLSSKYAQLLYDPYEVMLDLDLREVRSWSTLIPSYEFSPASSYFEILVPTVDTTRYRRVLDTLVSSGHNVLFMAETGVGKSVIVNSYLIEKVEEGKCISYVMGYSAQTSPSNLREILETKLDKKRKNLLGPPTGKKMLLFIDDLNLPILETYGAQPPNELLRQVLDQQGFYDTQKLFFKEVQGTRVIAACAPPGGGRNEVSPRLLRHFHLLWLTNLSTASLMRIFTSIARGFLLHHAPELADTAQPLVQASVSIYERIQKELLPTPLKAHYTFNLRDLSKVFQGVLMVEPKLHRDRNSLLRLWAHEGCRVFRDRLVSDEDKDWYNAAVLEQLQLTLDASSWSQSDFKYVLFGTFSTQGNKAYCEMCDESVLGKILVSYLEEYNLINASKMDLVFFRDALYHIARISRILAQPRGNALLVGVGGSGRRSLTRMASFMADIDLKVIEITRGYGVNEWREDLRGVLINAGAKNKPTVFLFSDTQIVRESFLEDINNVLNSGEVPNLFEADELEKIVNLVRPLAKIASKGQTREAILLHFISLVRANLHVVLCMSPIGSGFRNRCRMFPSLVNCCTIDWFMAWPREALYSVAKRAFEVQVELEISEYVDALASLCNAIHHTVKEETTSFYVELKRFNYTTPTSYLELIKMYVDILKTQRTRISNNEARYRNGLRKLKETEGMVAELETRLVQMQPVLERASVDASELLIQVARDQGEADVQAAMVARDVEAANKVAAEVKTIKDDSQADLDEAMPAYEAAVDALKQLDKKALQELKAFTNPPEMVKFTMEAVCILFDKPPDWGEAKKLLAQMDLLEKLAVFDKDNIHPKIIKKLQKYYNDPRFVPDEMKKISNAAMSLCMWSRAMVTYDRVAKSIEPRKEALRQAEESLEQTLAELDTKREGLRQVLERVAGLQRTLLETEQRKSDLQGQAELAKQQLVRAGLLIGGLGGEKKRWEQSAMDLSASKQNLVGDMALAAGFIAYLGPFTAGYRTKIIAQWQQDCVKLNVPCSDFSLLRVLADPVTLRSWQLHGLPADEFSCENGILTTMGRRWPLMIDPQGQANRWIRSAYADKNLQIIKLTEKEFLRTLENGVRYGAPVLLENVGETLDPSLEPVLLKQVFKKAGQLLIRLGDSDVPFSEAFKFFITTKFPNPHYMPEVMIKVTVINFTVTMKGLEDQLLVDVIKNERPDLEERRDALVVSIAFDQKQLRDIEEQILSMLAAASGNILDDEDLINALALSKKTSSAINLRLTEAETTTQEINAIREQYRVVATRGSVIYFVVAAMNDADPMYSYSMQFYKGLVLQRLQRTEKQSVLADRLGLLIADLTRAIYLNVCRGVFEKDKLLFSFLIAVRIQQAAGVVLDAEWQVFIRGIAPVDEVIEAHPLPVNVETAGISKRQWFAAVMLQHVLIHFSGLCAEISSSPKEWAYWFECETPETDKLPCNFDDKLGVFSRLLLIRVLREEKTIFATNRYVGEALGVEFTESPSFDLMGAFEDSSAATPLIFILSAGADPTDYLQQLAAVKGKKVNMISLGQGQGPNATRTVKASQQNGEWVCLQNCHLAVSWLNELEQIVEEMQSPLAAINSSSRLWLTSMPSVAFPVPILQNGIKITNEPPRGLRANLTRTFEDMSEDEFETSSNPTIFKKLLFATAFFNGLIIERRNFGAVGWNIPYDWMNSDLKAAMMQLRMYAEDRGGVPWETLNVVVADIIYGGRVTDVWDKRTISSLLRKLFTPALLGDGFSLSDGEDAYRMPTDIDLQTQIDFVRGLPINDAPELFGLHANAAITLQQKESRLLIAMVVSCSESGGGSSSADSNDSMVRDAARRLEIRMPALFDLRTAHPDSFKQSLGIFLGQELLRFNGLIEVMLSTLMELQRAIKGEVVMSVELETMYNCFVFQKVPPIWERVGYPCLKPLTAWIEDFILRIAFMGDWLHLGPCPCYWLPGFFFPQGFMTAVKQVYSRDHCIAVDTLTMGCEITGMDASNVVSIPSSGAYIYGLFMEGGRFNRGSCTMSDSRPRELYDQMPCIWLKPMLLSEYVANEGFYKCPVYKTSIRAGTLSTTGHSTNFVVALPVPSTVHEDHWIRRGCALLCMLDD